MGRGGFCGHFQLGSGMMSDGAHPAPDAGPGNGDPGWLADNKVRGIASADALRRLVAKILARQYQSTFRRAVEPHNFGITDRSGTDATVHLLQYLTDMHPG